MKRDLESRRLAIVRALRGRHLAASPASTAVAPPLVDEAVSAHMSELSETVSDLATRVDQLARDLSSLRSSAPVRHHIPELPHDPDDDEPVARRSVPPVTPAKISNHAFDVLLGRP